MCDKAYLHGFIGEGSSQHVNERVRQPHHIHYHIHTVPGHALLVTVCIFMLPLLVLSVLLNTTRTPHQPRRNSSPLSHCHWTPPMMLPHLDTVLPALVLQNNRAVQLNIRSSSSHSRVRRVSPSPGLSVPSGLGRMVVGMILLLLVLSGDVETNPGPVGESSGLMSCKIF